MSLSTLLTYGLETLELIAVWLKSGEFDLFFIKNHHLTQGLHEICPVFFTKCLI